MIYSNVNIEMANKCMHVYMDDLQILQYLDKRPNTES